MTPRRGSTVNGYNYQWSLFADWCAAADAEALPASPITLAEFFAENPAGDSVQLRRISAIKTDFVHVISGPGRFIGPDRVVSEFRAELTTAIPDGRIDRWEIDNR
nr:hypothetical protein [Rhodococcus sp. 06-418-1B]